LEIRQHASNFAGTRSDQGEMMLHNYPHKLPTRHQRAGMSKLLLDLAEFDCMAATWMWRPQDATNRRNLLARAVLLLRTRRRCWS
jgi:hypothetical protein